MKVSFADLRKKSARIIRALERKESVTVLYRGRSKAVMQPLSDKGGQRSAGGASGRRGRAARKAADHPAFGLWAKRDDLKNVHAHVRKLRQGRFGAH